IVISASTYSRGNATATSSAAFSAATFDGWGISATVTPYVRAMSAVLSVHPLQATITCTSPPRKLRGNDSSNLPITPASLCAGITMLAANLALLIVSDIYLSADSSFLGALGEQCQKWTLHGQPLPEASIAECITVGRVPPDYNTLPSD